MIRLNVPPGVRQPAEPVIAESSSSSAIDNNKWLTRARNRCTFCSRYLLLVLETARPFLEESWKMSRKCRKWSAREMKGSLHEVEFNAASSPEKRNTENKAKQMGLERASSMLHSAHRDRWENGWAVCRSDQWMLVKYYSCLDGTIWIWNLDSGLRQQATRQLPLVRSV